MSMVPANNRVPVGVIAIVLGVLGLGWLGIHKFMLGYSKTAVIGIIASVLTCGIAAAVLSIISIVEGIIYLSKSDSDFYVTYVARRKEWF